MDDCIFTFKVRSGWLELRFLDVNWWIWGKVGGYSLIIQGCNPGEGGMNMGGVLKRKYKNQDGDSPKKTV